MNKTQNKSNWTIPSIVISLLSVVPCCLEHKTHIYQSTTSQYFLIKLGSLRAKLSCMYMSHEGIFSFVNFDWTESHLLSVATFFFVPLEKGA